MSEARIPQKAPYAVDIEKDKSYWWCSCGRSQRQPFCDGSHAGTTFTPQEYKATESKTVYFCGCKQARNGPLCDGSHKAL